MTEIWYSDPIPQAFAHYEREVRETLESVGVTAQPVPWTRPVEGLTGPVGKARMMLNAGLNVVSAKRSSHPVMQLWPSLGLLEARVWSSRCHRHSVVLHDPRSIRSQFGHGSWSERWARRANQRKAPTVIVLSEYAYEVTRQRLPDHRIEMALHPILNDQAGRTKSAKPSVVVAGQFKTERDLTLLAELGPALRAAGWTTQIVGRGWPEVSGWDVDARFVSEEDLDELLATAWALLLPYKNYFQSGVAVRALELGTLTVGPRSSFLEALQGPSSALLVGDRTSTSEYLTAFDRVASGNEDAEQSFANYSARVRESWSRLVERSL